jgi:predicted AAA+ superfamily ATPase
MGPFDVLEAAPDDSSVAQLWLRGGFPDSFLARSDADSLSIRKDFVRTYLERDVPLFGPRIPAETLRRLWTMLAHGQGSMLNASNLAGALSTSAPTVTRYIDLLSDLLLVRRLTAYSANVGKRLVKSPRVYVRDSGLVHALLGLADANELAGHPVVGASWEGFVIEQLLSAAPQRTIASFYRASGGAKIDLVLEMPRLGRWAIEIKLGLAPKLQKGFHSARADLEPDRSFVVYSGTKRYRISSDVEAINVRELARILSNAEHE